MAGQKEKQTGKTSFICAQNSVEDLTTKKKKKKEKVKQKKKWIQILAGGQGNGESITFSTAVPVFL